MKEVKCYIHGVAVDRIERPPKFLNDPDWLDKMFDWIINSFDGQEVWALFSAPPPNDELMEVWVGNTSQEVIDNWAAKHGKESVLQFVS